jgi:hypothetical protein
VARGTTAAGSGRSRRGTEGQRREEVEEDDVGFVVIRPNELLFGLM